MTNFSETYYPTIEGYRLTPDQHKANNQWFAEMLDKLKDDGIPVSYTHLRAHET